MTAPSVKLLCALESAIQPSIPKAVRRCLRQSPAIHDPMGGILEATPCVRSSGAELIQNRGYFFSPNLQILYQAHKHLFGLRISNPHSHSPFIPVKQFLKSHLALVYPDQEYAKLARGFDLFFCFFPIILSRLTLTSIWLTSQPQL